jgi:uncharacterized membrane protein YeaQ/YmgE (transglycosylase-associated protein family)
VPVTTKKSRKPTKKWFAALAAGVGSILVHFGATEFTFGDTEEGMITALVVGLVGAYLKENDWTPGGVPVERV